MQSNNDSILSFKSVHARLGDICNPEPRTHTVCHNLCFHCRGLQGLPCQQETPKLDVIFKVQRINHGDVQNHVAAWQCQPVTKLGFLPIWDNSPIDALDVALT